MQRFQRSEVLQSVCGLTLTATQLSLSAHETPRVASTSTADAPGSTKAPYRVSESLRARLQAQQQQLSSLQAPAHVAWPTGARSPSSSPPASS